MTRLGAYSLYALLTAAVLGGLLLAAPSPGELGFFEEMDCAAFLEAPTEIDSVRLTDCTVPLDDLTMRRGDEQLRVFAGALPADARRALSRIPGTHQASGHRDQYSRVDLLRERYLERHADELQVTVDLEGAVRDMGHAPAYFVIGRSQREPVLRAIGLSLLIVGLPLLLLFARAERRWHHRTTTLGSGTAQPKRF